MLAATPAATSCSRPPGRVWCRKTTRHTGMIRPFPALATTMIAVAALVTSLLGPPSVRTETGTILGRLAASPTSKSLSVGEGRASIHYWGLTARGDYFHTIDRDPAEIHPLSGHHPETSLPLVTVIPASFGVPQVGRSQPPPGPGGFVCSRLVSAPSLVGRNLSVTVQQTCTGLFKTQWVGWQYQRSSWTGYRPYSGLHETHRLGTHSATSALTALCPGPGSYDYRVATTGFAVASDGTVVADRPNSVIGNSARFGCGDGPVT